MARKGLTLRLTDESRAGWDAVALRHGMNLTALMEAIGLALKKNSRLLPDKVVDEGRSIQAARRRR